MQDFIEISPDGAASQNCERAYDTIGRNGSEKPKMLDFDTGEWVAGVTVPLGDDWQIESGQCGPLIVDGVPGIVVVVDARKESEGLTPQVFEISAYVFTVDSPDEPVHQVSITEDVGERVHSLEGVFTWADSFAVNLSTTVIGANSVSSVEAFRVDTAERIWSREEIRIDGERRAPKQSSADQVVTFRSVHRHGVLDLESGETIVEAGNTVYDEDYATFEPTGAGVVVGYGSMPDRVEILRNGTRSPAPIPNSDLEQAGQFSGSEGYLGVQYFGEAGPHLVVYELDEMKPVYSLSPQEYAGLDVQEFTVVEHYLRLHKTDEVVLMDLLSGDLVAEKEDEYVTSILPNGWGTADVPAENLTIQQCLVYLKDSDTPISYDFN